MSEKYTSLVAQISDIITEEALKAQDGKVVPLCVSPGGPVIGEATLKYNTGEKVLEANFQFDDPKVAELFLGPMPDIFTKES